MLLSTTNYPPTGLALSNDSLAEHQPAGTEVGRFIASDPDEADTFTYTLVDGIGSRDNALFAIAGNALITGVSLEYDPYSAYRVRVRVADQDGSAFEREFAIFVSNVTEPVGSFGVVDGQFRQLTVDGAEVGNYCEGIATFALKGGGTGTLYDDHTLVLSGTTAESVLTVRGRYLLYSITADGPLQRITAPKLYLGLYSEPGSLVLNTGQQDVGDATVAIRFQTANDLSIQTNGLPIRSLFLRGWMDWDDTPHQIVAPWIGKIRVIRAPGRAGSLLDGSQSGKFRADVVTSSSHRGVAIGSIRTTGAISGSRIWAAGGIGRIAAKRGLWDSRIAAAGSIGAVSLGFMEDSSILVGVTPDVEGAFVQTANEFADPSARLGNLSIRTMAYSPVSGEPAVFRNNHISAPLIDKVSLADVPSDSGRFIHVLQDVPMLRIRESGDGMLDHGTWPAGKPGRPEIVEVLG